MLYLNFSIKKSEFSCANFIGKFAVKERKLKLGYLTQFY